MDEYDVFLFCFSLEKDSLSQWRAYTPKDGGYALGFKTHELISLIEKKEGDLFIAKNLDQSDIYISIAEDEIVLLGNCIYYDGSREHIKRMQKVSQNIHSKFIECMKNGDKDKLNIILSNNDLSKLIVSSLVKDKSFDAEREVRIALIQKREKRSDIQFIGGKPRMKIDIDNLLDCVEKNLYFSSW